MPLRDHFRPPTSKAASWEALHGQWPAVLVQQLKTRLPPGYVAAPRVHLGPFIEIDIAAAERGLAAPSVAVETEVPDDDEYAVRVYDTELEHTLVAAIEIVSPGNKDRPDKRNAFVGKCAALLRAGVAVTIVDVVTARHFNLYAELMAFIGQSDPTLGAEPPPLYAASCRWVPRGGRGILETWSHVLTVGRPLPVLPLWLSGVRVIPLDLEKSYEKACDDLSIP